MTETDTLGRAALTGAIAGLVGGMVFGFGMNQLGVPQAMALLLVAPSIQVAYALHLTIAAIAGAGFGVAAQWQRTGSGETVLLGIGYGMLWWLLLPLTVQPIFLLTGPAWDADTLASQFPGLVGHLLYGLSTGLVLVLIRERPGRGDSERDLPTRGATLGLGALAGLVAAWLLALVAGGSGQPGPLEVPGLPGILGTLLLGALAGLGYALLYPASLHSAGVALVHGQAFGFVLWLVGPLSLFPLLSEGQFTWLVTEAWTAFAALTGTLLLGALTALLYHWFTAVRVFLTEETRTFDRDGGGRLKALGGDVVAGSVGGLLFTLVMASSGFLATAARLVGSEEAVVGLLVHLAISVGIGISYGLLFRRQSYSLATGLGWGVSYGFFWWLVGPLTLLPIMLGGAPQWSAEAASTAFESLVGHLAYGAGLAAVFYLLERRLNPNWRTVALTASPKTRRLHVQALTSGPPLWSAMIVIILTIPVILGQG